MNSTYIACLLCLLLLTAACSKEIREARHTGDRPLERPTAVTGGTQDRAIDNS